MVLLEGRKVNKYFGGLAATNNLDFDLNEGEILGIIGPNGAGKTTLLNLISGFERPTGGKIIFKGERIDHLQADNIAKKGIVRTFQQTALFINMTVLENVVVGQHLHANTEVWRTFFNTSSARRGEGDIRQKARETLRFLGLASFEDKLAKNLPHGQQKLLGVGIALAANPELLLLDEPVAGMTPKENEDMIGLIRHIRDSGTTVILVEHVMKTVMVLVDRIIVLNYGRKIAEGSPDEIKRNREVIEAYLGTGEGT